MLYKNCAFALVHARTFRRRNECTLPPTSSLIVTARFRVDVCWRFPFLHEHSNEDDKHSSQQTVGTRITSMSCRQARELICRPAFATQVLVIRCRTLRVQEHE